MHEISLFYNKSWCCLSLSWQSYLDLLTVQLVRVVRVQIPSALGLRARQVLSISWLFGKSLLRLVRNKF